MEQEGLLEIVERITGGKYSKEDVDLLREALSDTSSHSRFQLGKYNINIERGGEGIHIGDHTYCLKVDDAAIRAVAKAIQEKVTLFPKEETTPINFEPYLKSLVEEENQDGRQRTYVPLLAEEADSERLGPSQPQFTPHEMMSSWGSREPTNDERDRNQTAKRKPPIDVLDGLRQDALAHVLIVGKPGSGKSTSLNRLLGEEAQKALLDPDVKIPILIKLRRHTTTIEDSIRDSLTRHHLSLGAKDIERNLKNGRFFLLLDGWNELQAQYQLEVINFCDKYRYSTPIVISARALASTGGLRVSKVLTMLPLTKSLIQEFASAYLKKKEHSLLRYIERDRLQQLAETPLLLRMLCWVYKQNGRIPKSLGAAFREFARLHDQSIQGDAPAQTKEIWGRLLRHMAFDLMQGDNAAEPKLSISKETAEDLLTKYLKDEDRTNPRELAECGLRELLSYHLIQLVVRSNFEEEIEFHHQLIQEYYAAESLLSRVETISDKSFQHDYINYLKWTEPLSLMLSLMSKKSEVLRLIKLSAEVDLTLCARFCGDVRLEFQEAALKFLMKKLNASLACEKKKAKLLGISRSDKAILYLDKILDIAEVSSALTVIEALEHIASDLAIQALMKITDHQNPLLRSSAIRSLGILSAKQAFEKIEEKLDDPNEGVRFSAVPALASIGTVKVISSLLKALDDQSETVREQAAIALSSTPHLFNSDDSLLEKTISALLNEVRKSRGGNHFYSSEYALKALGRLNSSELRKLVPELLVIARAHPNKIARADILKLVGNVKPDLALKVLSEIVKDYGLSLLIERSILSAKAQHSQPKTLDINPTSEVLTEEYSVEKQQKSVALTTEEKVDFYSFIEEMSENISSSDINIRKRAIWFLGGLFKFDSRHFIQESFDFGETLEIEDCVQVVVDILVPCLSDPEYDIWTKAALNLGKVCSPSSLPALIELSMKTSNEEVDNAIRAIQTKHNFYNYEVKKKKAIQYE